MPIREAQMLTRVSLIYCTVTTAKKWKREKLKSTKKTDMLRSISKQSGKSVESILKTKRKATPLQWEGFAEGKVFRLELKSEGVA